MKDSIYQLLEPRQWKKLYDFIDSYFLSKPAALLAAVLFLILIVLVICAIRVQDNRKTVIKRVVFWDYVLIILLLSILNREEGPRTLRLTFDSWAASETTWHESNILISLVDSVYFLPYGALARWQFSGRMGWVKAFLIVTITGFLVESLQYVFARGTASVGDLAAYMVGGSMGIILVSIFERTGRKNRNTK